MTTKRTLLLAVLLVACVFSITHTEVKAQGALIARPSPIYTGKQIQVTWGIGASYESNNEWIAMYTPESSDANEITRQSVQGQSGVAYFQAPNSPGQVQFRLFSNGQKLSPSNIVDVVTAPSGNTGGSSDYPSSPPQPTDARKSDGGVDVIIFCKSLNYDSAVNTDNSATGWTCTKGNITGGPMDWNRVCQAVYDNSYHAVNPYNSAGGWKCVQGGDNPPPSNTNCGPKPSRLNPGDTATVSDFDPSPLYVYNERDVRTGVKFTVPIREVVTLIQGPSCAWDVTWWEIGYQDNTGWAIEENAKGSYNLIPNGQPLPGPGGNGEPQQPAQTPSNSTGLMCGGSALDTDSKTEFVMYFQNPSEEPLYIQCGNYVADYLLKTYGFDLTKYNGGCTSSPVKYWIDSARKCGLVVDQNTATVQKGDVALWPQNCGIAGDDGHVAVVLAPPSVTNDGKIEVTDANHWDPTTKQVDGKVYPDWKWPLATCMYFIHTSLAFEPSGNNPPPSGNGNTGGQQGGNGGQSSNSGGNIANTRAKSITWGFCFLCTSQAWIEFDLPTNLSAYNLSFEGKNIPVEDMSVNTEGSNTKVVCHVSALTIQREIDAGYWNQLGNPANWNLTYLPTK